MVHALDIHLSSCKHDSVIEKFPLLEMVIVWIRGSVVDLVVAFMDLSAQQVLPAMNIFWLNIIDCFDRMLFSESRMYLCLLLDFSYSLPSCFSRGVPLLGLIIGTYSVVLRDLFTQCAVEPLLVMRVDTAVAVVVYILVIAPGLANPFWF